MKKRQVYKTLGIVVAASLLLSSCGKKVESTTRYSPAQIVEAIISAQGNISPLEPLLPEDDYYPEYLENIYHLDVDSIKDGAIYYAHGMQADEISVFLLADSTSANDIKEALTIYKERRAEAFMGYAPEQAAILDNSIVAVNGDYVALLICEEPQNAQSVFMACFSDNPPKISRDIELLKPENSNGASEADSDADGQEQTPADSVQSFTVPANNNPDDKPTDDGPDDNKPDNDDKPTDEKPTDEEPDDDKPTDEKPTDEKPTDEKPTDEKPTDEKPTDEKPTDEKPTDEKPTDEKPTDEKPTDEKPTDEKPTDEKPTDVPANQEDVYDPASILKAWQSGDTTGLTHKNLRIFEACTEVIGALIGKNMSDYEKELTIHDWIIDWADYDEETLSNSPNAKPDPDNDNPYGTLYQKKAICSGYTSTFQIFMDLLGIECITIHGTYTLTGEEHAWNMVRIDGEWYCVDVTWDDPLGSRVSTASKHEYFNVTTSYMKSTRHQWDESTTPVADAGKLYYG